MWLVADGAGSVVETNRANNSASTHIDLFVRPANDAFTAASALTLPVTGLSGDTRGASVESGEPTPACGQIDRSAWYLLTPTASGTLNVTLGVTGSGFSGVLALYSGSSPPG